MVDSVTGKHGVLIQQKKMFLQLTMSCKVMFTQVYKSGNFMQNMLRIHNSSSPLLELVSHTEFIPPIRVSAEAT